MKASIFRAAAIERLSTPDRLDQPLRITTPLGWLALGALMALVVASCVASAVIAVPVKVTGQGIIISPTGVRDIPFASGGRLADILVHTGDHVARGQLVARLDQPELQWALDQALAQQRNVADERARVVAFQSVVGRSQADADEKLRHDLVQSTALARERIGYLQEREAIDADLFAKNLTTRGKVVDTKVEMGAAQEQLATEERQIDDIDHAATARRIAFARELLDLDQKAAAAAQQVELLTKRLTDGETVTSPYDGTVGEIKHNVGELVRQGAGLLALLPDEASGASAVAAAQSSLIAVIYVPASDGKKIAAGMTAEIEPSTVRREEFGFIFGRVRSVAELPSTQDGMMRILGNPELVTALSASGAPFEVEVELDRDAKTRSGFRWSSGHGPDTTVTPGTLARGQVWVHRQRLIEFAIPALHGLFGDNG
jgi:HlyD family secretion protein